MADHIGFAHGISESSTAAEATARKLRTTARKLRMYDLRMSELPTAFTDAIRDGFLIEREIVVWK